MNYFIKALNSKISFIIKDVLWKEKINKNKNIDFKKKKGIKIKKKSNLNTMPEILILIHGKRLLMNTNSIQHKFTNITEKKFCWLI